MYGLSPSWAGGVAGESVVVIGPGPIGLLAVAVSKKALGAEPVTPDGKRANNAPRIGNERGRMRLNIAGGECVEVVKPTHRGNRRRTM